LLQVPTDQLKQAKVLLRVLSSRWQLKVLVGHKIKSKCRENWHSSNFPGVNAEINEAEGPIHQ
jgi:hypothetical protein